MSGSSEHTNILRRTLSSGSATMLSRILGLIRVKFEALVLGGGEIASGWFFAFSVANFFRRILGEGALATALMPFIADADKEGGEKAIREKLGILFPVLSIILAVLILLICGGTMLLAYFTRHAESGLFATQRMRITLQLLPLLMPYSFFMCLVGITGSVLNYLKIFFIPALGALSLNVGLITVMAIGYFAKVCKYNAAMFLEYMGYAVLLSGAVQLVIMLWVLYRQKCMPHFNELVLKLNSPFLRELLRKALPGFISSIALQCSMIIDRILAARLNSQAIPALVYIDRLIDLPIGLFAVSLGTVLMAGMSRSAASGKYDEMMDNLVFSLRQICFTCIPLAVMVSLFHAPMLRLLCVGGKYTESDLLAARFVAVFYGFGIPFFCSLKAVIPAFQARKSVNKPLIASLFAIVLNLVLNLILMNPLQQGGLALATLISSVTHNAILLWMLNREGFQVPLKKIAVSFLHSAVISAIMGTICWILMTRTTIFLSGSGNYLRELLAFAGNMLIFAGGYAVINLLTKSEELRELRKILHI